MPLRKIMVDWQEQSDPNGSGTVAGGIPGYYSNYKPFCADGGNAKECVLNNVSFGMTCSNKYDCPLGYGCSDQVGPHFGNQSGQTCVGKSRPKVGFFVCVALSVS